MKWNEFLHQEDERLAHCSVALKTLNAAVFLWLWPCFSGCDHVSLSVTMFLWLRPCVSGCDDVSLAATMFLWLRPCFSGCDHVSLAVTMFLWLWPCFSGCDHVSLAVTMFLWLWPCFTGCARACLHYSPLSSSSPAAPPFSLFRPLHSSSPPILILLLTLLLSPTLFFPPSLPPRLLPFPLFSFPRPLLPLSIHSHSLFPSLPLFPCLPPPFSLSNSIFNWAIFLARGTTLPDSTQHQTSIVVLANIDWRRSTGVFTIHHSPYTWHLSGVIHGRPCCWRGACLISLVNTVYYLHPISPRQSVLAPTTGCWYNSAHCRKWVYFFYFLKTTTCKWFLFRCVIDISEFCVVLVYSENIPK